MNRVILCLLFSLTLWGASSQKVYFIYLQAEQEQPFYIKMNEKLYSSTGSGYLILSRLRDSSYSFNVGFPQYKWPEQNFTVPVKSKDHGYLLKYFGEKGWGLFDLQALTVQMSMVPATKTGNAVKPETKEVSAFTDILSKASDDPSLKEKPVAVTEQPTVKKDEKLTGTYIPLL